MRELLRKRTLKPFFIVSLASLFCQFSGFILTRPYIIYVIKSYGTPIDSYEATVWFGVSGVIGTITCVLTVKFVGKRGLFLGALSLVCFADIALSELFF